MKYRLTSTSSRESLLTAVGSLPIGTIVFLPKSNTFALVCYNVIVNLNRPGDTYDLNGGLEGMPVPVGTVIKLEVIE